MYETTLSVEGTGAYSDATEGTEIRIELWCTDHCDLLHVVGRPTEAVLARVSESVGVNDTLARGNEMVIVTDDCLKNHTTDVVDQYFARHGCLLLPPLQYENGAKRCRLLALDPGVLTDCYHDLISDNIPVTVESKRTVESVSRSPLFTLDGVVPDLTPRQRETIRTAYNYGYYRIPRETTTAEIAESIGVDRRTAEEHLRRAENKLIDSVIEYIPV